jgi:hypothetical protein
MHELSPRTRPVCRARHAKTAGSALRWVPKVSLACLSNTVALAALATEAPLGVLTARVTAQLVSDLHPPFIMLSRPTVPPGSPRL